ncbi:MAG TPA: alpha/beta hydrolase [Gemmatimonadaceae bacterium]|nr:alpha/beta hydrolase [Gemmatimonadaceae bacterium]
MSQLLGEATRRSQRYAFALSVLAAGVVSSSRVAAGQGSSAGYIRADSSRVYYEECGQGVPLVLLHDGLMHSATWDGVWSELCRKFHVLRYDRRGMGRSDQPKIPFLPTEDLSALLADRHLEHATLIGSSSGAGLAVDYAFRHPDRVDRLILIGPVVHGMTSSQYFLDRGARNSAPLAKGDVSSAARNWADDRFQIAGPNAKAREELYRALVAYPQNLTYSASLELRFAVPAAARLGEIRAPTLILVGESDIADVHAYAGAIELGVWGSVREIVVGAGHLVQLEQPAWLVNRITAFITATPVVSVGSARLQSLAGTYTPVLYGRPGEFVVREDRLVARVATERDLSLFAANDSTFYALGWDGVHFVFHRDSLGRGTRVQITSAREPAHSALRTPPT